MKLRQRGFVATILMATLVVSPLVEAKRAGSGKSQGMQRSMGPSQSRQSAPFQQQRAPQQAPIATQQQNRGSNTGKMVAAGVAGAAIGAVAANALADDKTPSHSTANTSQSAEMSQQQPNEVSQQQRNEISQQQPAEKKSGIPSWIWLILIAGAAFFIFRKIGAKKKLENSSSNSYASNNGGTAPSPFGQNNTQNSNSNIYGQSVNGLPNSNTTSLPTNNSDTLPDGTEQAAFLRIARQRFNHIQSMNTASNIEEIRRYLTSDLYNSMYQDIMANRDQDVAEFQNLTTEIADTATENGQYVTSVRFTGLVSEDLNSQPQPFTEVWHFVKPINSQQDWLVAGIQVES